MTKTETSKLALILALSDFNGSLSPVEQENIADIATTLEMDSNPDTWLELETVLLDTIQGQEQLNQSYHHYKNSLEQLGTIPSELLPKAQEIAQIPTSTPVIQSRGFAPESSATGYEEQINNAVIVVGKSEQPEIAVKQLQFTDKLKQFLNSKI